MPLDTQSTLLSQSPYYDDYDETKNLHRVLFKPSVAVQARELTQLQTILQSQIERFGDNIYQTGTIIKGCALTVDPQYWYVKLFDLQTNGEAYDASALTNTYVYDANTTLNALIVNATQGGQQLNPDLNTIYVKYLNTGVSGEKSFSNDAVLSVYNRSYRVETITVVSGGALYANSDTINFTGSVGVGAVGQVVTYANGTIRNVSVVDGGSGYITTPTITITTSTGSSANLVANTMLSQVRVANSTYTNPVGRGTALRTSDGIIYQKGHFINVYGHEVILSKYDNYPDSVSAGFVTSESVVNSNADSTLLDNASGTTNYTAPGADRLKLSANLVVLSTAAAAANADFLSLYDFEDGRVVKDRTTTQFNSINSELSRRTFEESGNYVVNDFPMFSDAISSNNTHLNLQVGAGVAYVKGERVQLLNNTKHIIRKSTDIQSSSTQTITTAYGGFVYVYEYMGAFDITSGASVDLYNDTTSEIVGGTNVSGTTTTSGVTITGAFVAGGDVQVGARVAGTGIPTGAVIVSIVTGTSINISLAATASATVTVTVGGDVRYGRLALTRGNGIGAPSGGNIIGQARVRSISFDSGIPGTATARYRLYLFDVVMSSGYNFGQVRTIYYSGGTIGAVADVVWDAAQGIAVQNDATLDSLLFDTGTFAVKELNNETFIFRSSANVTSRFSTAGVMEFSLSGGAILPYTVGTILNSIQERDLVVVPVANCHSTTNNPGTVSFTSGANTLTGTSTTFSIAYNIGDFVRIANNTFSETKQITAIVSNTSLQIANTWSIATGSSYNHSAAFFGGVPIDFSPATRTIQTTTSNTIRFTLPFTLNAQTDAVVYLDQRLDTPSFRTKSVNKYYTALSTTKLTTSTTGPWCLGVPDVISLVGVYVGTANSYSESGTNYVREFVLENGQQDSYYGLAYLKKKPGSTLALGPTNCLTVVYKAFTVSAGSYMSAESYAATANDTVSTLPDNRIRTYQIPVYTSPKTGTSYDLRDYIDFRPYTANSIPLITSLGAANTTNSGNTTAYIVDPAVYPGGSSVYKFDTSAKYFPSPTREFSATIDSYLARQDRVVIDPYGKIRVIEGFPSNTPSVPGEPEGTMTIGLIKVPQYPSLSAKEAADGGRPDLGVYVVPQQNRRYTMKDISDIEKRINRLEYYTLLNTLETTTKQLVLPSEANNSIERFKNGFFVDPLTDYNVSNIQDPEYHVMIDPGRGVARPYFADVKIDLQFSSASSNVVHSGDLAMMNYSERAFLSQPLATRDRTLVDQYWKYKSTLTVVPSFDNFYDVERSTVSIAIDIASPINNFAQATAAALSNLNISTNLMSTVDVGAAIRVGGNGSAGTTDIYKQNTTQSFIDQKTGLNGGSTSTSTQNLGANGYVNDVSLAQYIREQRITILATGLRPGAQHYVFFDGVSVSSRVTPARVDLSLASLTPSDFIVVGTLGGILTANSSGCVAAFVDIPGSTYFVGERNIMVMDADNMDSQDTAISSASGRFTAYSFNVSKTNLTVSTKSIDVAGGGGYYANTYSLNRAVDSARYYAVDIPAPQSGDPLAQTFLVQPQLANTDGIFVTSVDLFFKQKDPVQGVSVELRETSDAGYPTSIVLPFSRTYKRSASVTVSNTAISATTFTFPAPVYLKVGGVYALVVTPDASTPEYRIHTAVTGGRDLTNTSLAYNANWGLGSLFYSTSGSTWSAVQDEDLKFSLKRANFSALTGKVILNNADYEFVTVSSNTSGYFRGGEDIAQLHPNNYINTTTSTVTTSTSNNNILTSSSLTSSIAPNDKLLMIYGTTQSVATGNVSVTGTLCTNIAGSTTGSGYNVPFPSGSFVKLGNSSVGEIRQVISSNTTSITIDRSLFATPITNIEAYQLSPTFQVATVLTANTSTLTLNKFPTVATSSTVQVTLQKAVTGVVDNYNYSNNKVYISQSSTANSDYKIFAANSTYLGTLVGDTSQSRVSVVSVDNINVNYFRPMFSTIVSPGTGISLTANTTKSSGATTLSAYDINQLNALPYNDSALVKSKSNEVIGAVVTKSFTATLDMSSSSYDISPVLDITPTSIVVTRNIVDNYNISNFTANTTTLSTTITADNSANTLYAGQGVRGLGIRPGTIIQTVSGNTITLSVNATSTATSVVLSSTPNETSRYGLSLSKYVSKRLSLADGMDAEDVRVYLTAYKPYNTSIDVYAKILNYSDGEAFNDKDWTLLSQATNLNTYSSELNEEDYREYEYTFPSTPPSTKLPGVVSTTTFSSTLSAVTIANTTGGFTATSTSALQVGSLLVITGAYGGTGSITGYVNPTTYRVSAVPNSTTFTITTTAGVAIVTTAGTPTGLTYTVPTAILGIDTAFSSDLVAGDLVKIVRTSATTDYDLLRVDSVVNNTAIYTTTSVSFSATGCTFERVDQPLAAFKYYRNYGVVRYHNISGASYDGYKYMAIKLVLRSPYTYTVPIVNDIRALAISV